MDYLHLFKNSGTIIRDEYFASGVLDLKKLLVEKSCFWLPFYPYREVQVKCVQHPQQL